MSSRPKGRVKENVAGERYDTNAIPVAQPARSNSARRPLPNMGDLMGALGGGMPDMGQMMEMMQKMGMGGMPGMPGMGGMPGMPGMPGMGGMPPGMPGMPGMPPGMMPPMVPVLPKAVYYNLPEGTPTNDFFTFYPNYINAKKTVQEGRRITKDKACEDPLAPEMSEVCQYLKLPHVLEPTKKYAREWQVPGRVRVRLVKADGSFENPEIKTRKDLMLKMGELIPKLQSRKDRLAREAAEAASAASASASGAAAASSGSSKKKGKKKGKR